MPFKEKCKNCWRKLGPGLITGVSDDDPSGIATYSQAGARFGFSFLWAALLTYPLMFGIQEMCARIGIVSSNGLAGIIKKYYPPIIYWITLILIAPAILFNIAADISSMGAVSHLLIPTIHPYIFNTVFTVAIFLFIVFYSYIKFVRLMKYLCLTLICYFIVPFLVNIDWTQVVYSTFIPQFEWSKHYFLMLVAILGTTISPYLFFWQASLSREHKIKTHQLEHKEISEMRFDVNMGMFASNLAMYFIILTTGAVLFQNGIKNISTVEEAAHALKPLAGELAYLFFSLGILGVAFVALPVLSGCIGYIFAEGLGWRKGLDCKFHEAPKFYSIIGISLLLGLLISFFGIDPIFSLVLSAAIYGILTPPLIALILHICNNKKIVNLRTNGIALNALGVFTFLLMSASAIILFILSFR